MIEYRHLKPGRTSAPNYKWSKLHKNTAIRPSDFEKFEIRIFGIVYTEYSDEFKKVFKEAMMWRSLSD